MRQNFLIFMIDTDDKISSTYHSFEMKKLIFDCTLISKKNFHVKFTFPGDCKRTDSIWLTH